MYMFCEELEGGVRERKSGRECGQAELFSDGFLKRAKQRVLKMNVMTFKSAE